MNMNFYGKFNDIQDNLDPQYENKENVTDMILLKFIFHVNNRHFKLSKPLQNIYVALFSWIVTKMAE